MTVSTVEYIAQESWYRQTTDSTTTPNYHALKESGAMLPIRYYKRETQEGVNPLAATFQHGVQQIDRNSYTADFARTLRTGSTSMPYGHSSCRDLQSFHDEIGNRLLAKVRDTVIDVGVFVGEFPELVGYVHDTARRIAAAYMALRRGNLTKARKYLLGARLNKARHKLLGSPKRGEAQKSLKYIADLSTSGWLSYYLAVRPLMADVLDAITLFDEGLRNPFYPISVKTSKQHQINCHGSTPQGASYVVTGTVKASGGAIVRLTDPFAADLQQLGLVNIPYIAWNVIPFTFVLDYFIPVGQYLESFMPPQGVEWVQGWTYVKGQGVGTRSDNFTEYYAYPAPGYHLVASTRSELKERRALDDFPEPSLIIPDLSLSKTQVGNMMSLLWKAYRS